MQETVIDSTSAADWEKIHPILDEVMLELNERDREAILLRFFEGLPFSNIGLHLSVTEKGAHMRVERALHKLRARFASRGITSSAATLAAILGSQAGMAAPSELAAAVTGAAMASAPIAVSLPTAVALAAHVPAGLASSIGISAILCLFSAGAGVYELRNGLRSEESLNSANAQYEAEQVQLRALERSNQAVDQALADLQRKVDQLHSVNPIRTASAADTLVQSQKDWQQFQSAFPKAREMLAEVGKAQRQAQYGSFFLRAGLTPAQIQEFENRTAEFMMQNIAIAPGFVHPTANQLPDDQLRTILGGDAFQEFQDYNRMMPANSAANTISSLTSFAGAPISTDQAEKLAQIIADNCPAYKSGQAMGESPVDWAYAQVQAQALLSPTQWQAAENVFLNWQYEQALTQAQGE